MIRLLPPCARGAVVRALPCCLLAVAGLLVLVGPPPACGEEPQSAATQESRAVSWVGVDNETGTSQAVVVADAPLLHTAQFLPIDAEKTAGNVAVQFESVWRQLQDVLDAQPKARAVKLNFYATSDKMAADVRRLLKQLPLDDRRSAVSFVVTALPEPGAVVALDAVAVAETGKRAQAVNVVGEAAGAATLMPPGGRVYVSGQAEKGTDLASATRLTLESLDRTLKFLDLDRRHVAQVKAFMAPMTQAEVVREEVRRFFGEKQAPPLVLVEWQSTLPIEIELVAWGGPARRDAPAIEYLTPPKMTASPVYSRVARVNHGPTIYIAGLYAETDDPGEAEVADIFQTLQELLEQAGGDLGHLVKATYYVSTAEASSKLNELRPRYYNPHRPPAASKAQVVNVAHPARGLTIDMIAVPAPSR